MSILMLAQMILFIYFTTLSDNAKWEGVSVATDLCILDHLALAFQFLHPHFDLPQSRPILIGASNNVGYLRAA